VDSSARTEPGVTVGSLRATIEMTIEEQAAFLANEPFGVLGTMGHRGHPHLVTIGFAVDEEGVVVMTSFRSAQKVVNARRVPAGSILVERAGPYGEIQGTLLSGRLTVADDPREVARCYRLVKRRSEALLDMSDFPPVDDAALISKRVALLLAVERRSSWDHRKLDGVY
jgi:hypothetical protein